MPQQPELGPAVTQLITAVQKGGANILMWAAMALVGAAPVALQQINANRGPGSVEYLNPGDFQILGPERAEAGTLVRLTVADYEPTDVCWYTIGDSQKYGPNGSEIMFAMPGAPAFVTCSIIRNGKLYLTQKTVDLAPGEPVAPSEPTPTPVEPAPDPEPVEPEIEPLSEVGAKALKLARENDLTASDAQKLAANLRQAAKDSEGTNPRSLVLATAELNKDLDLPDGATAGIQVLLQTLAENGEMVTMEQHLEVWRQMAAGFESHAQ